MKSIALEHLQLLVHGARATVRWVEGKVDRRSQCIGVLVARRGTNRATVAVANKNARIAWALLTTDSVYQVEHATIVA